VGGELSSATSGSLALTGSSVALRTAQMCWRN